MNYKNETTQEQFDNQHLKPARVLKHLFDKRKGLLYITLTIFPTLCRLTNPHHFM